jgi:hypothetical protein
LVQSCIDPRFLHGLTGAACARGYGGLPAAPAARRGESAERRGVGEPKDDAEDYALDIWAVVIPIRQVIGAIENDPKLKAGVALPEHLRRFADGAQFDALLSESTSKLAKAAE